MLTMAPTHRQTRPVRAACIGAFLKCDEAPAPYIHTLYRAAAAAGGCLLLLLQRFSRESLAAAMLIQCHHVCDLLQLNSCRNSKNDGDETGVDCGGAWCQSCGSNAPCSSPSDCKSGVCTNSRCEVGRGALRVPCNVSIALPAGVAPLSETQGRACPLQIGNCLAQVLLQLLRLKTAKRRAIIAWQLYSRVARQHRISEPLLAVLKTNVLLHTHIWQTLVHLCAGGRLPRWSTKRRRD